MIFIFFASFHMIFYSLLTCRHTKSVGSVGVIVLTGILFIEVKESSRKLHT